MAKRVRLRGKCRRDAIHDMPDDPLGGSTGPTAEDPDADIGRSSSDETVYEYENDGASLDGEVSDQMSIDAEPGVLSSEREAHVGQLCLGDDGDDTSGVELGSDTGEQTVQGPRGWVPGSSCGSWITRTSPLQAQSQILLVNVVLAFRKLPRTVLQTMLPGDRVSTFPLFIQASASFLCLSASRIWRAYKEISDAGWEPTVLDEPPRGEAEVAETRSHSTLLTLVRAALSESINGASERSFVKHISRLALDGVDVGGKFHTRHFVKEAKHLAAKVLQAQDRLDLDRKLPGLGIPSCFAVLFDGVPVGGVSTWNRHGSVEVICVACVSTVTGLIHARFVTWTVSRVGHRGSDMADTILDALAEKPLALDRTVLRRRLASIGGDGAVVRGGPDRKRPGTQAADLMWFSVFPMAQPHPQPPDDDAPLGALVERPRGEARRHDAWVNSPGIIHTVTEWDKFHRQDIAMTRAIAACPLRGGALRSLCLDGQHVRAGRRSASSEGCCRGLGHTLSERALARHDPESSAVVQRARPSPGQPQGLCSGIARS